MNREDRMPAGGEHYVTEWAERQEAAREAARKARPLKAKIQEWVESFLDRMHNTLQLEIVQDFIVFVFVITMIYSVIRLALHA